MPALCFAGEAGPVDDGTFPCSNIDLAYFLDFQDLSDGDSYVTLLILVFFCETLSLIRIRKFPLQRR